jgi:hypothetical protein
MSSIRDTSADEWGIALRDGIARAVAVAALGGVALIHLMDLPAKFDETPYMAWMYIALIAGCVCLAGALWRSTDSRVWAAAVALPVSVLVGFTLSRTTGLPQANGDIGNWTESLGLASLFVEGALVALAGSVLLARMTERSQAELLQHGFERAHPASATGERHTVTSA